MGISINNVPDIWDATTTGITYTTPGSKPITITIANTTSAFVISGQISEPQLQVRNTGGAGGATFRFTDDLSGGDWKFKGTTTGGFKIRDQAGAADPVNIEAGCPTNTLFLLASGNVAIGSNAAVSKLRVVGLPTASAGLAAGDIWVDTTGGLNILKIV